MKTRLSPSARALTMRRPPSAVRPSRPRLVPDVGGRGATGDRPGGWLTSHDVGNLVLYAAERFVTLVPEIEMPGHTGAVFRAYPKLGPDEPAVMTLDGTELPIGNLDPDRGITWTSSGTWLTQSLLSSPRVLTSTWAAARRFGMPEETHARFIEQAAAVVKSRGRRVAGWQELARADIGDDDLVQYWMEPDDFASPPQLEAIKRTVPEQFLPLLLENLARSGSDVPAALETGATCWCRRPAVCTSTDRTPQHPSTPPKSTDVHAWDCRCTRLRRCRMASIGTRRRNPARH